ncbi:efflux transporter outer membrane subunit [Derxia gummosa]|uniref:Efflux transporter outer membrane subunit n=1 Tax=Derxia gummosa DSM 723 TaxID=1121388 RepID=A0A8B6X2G4_9BURK|nr:efflux transporter outer membrane subunit [Derxia gummosa]
MHKTLNLGALTALAAALLLAGCANLAPDYHQPAAPVPQQWPGVPSGDGTTTIAPGSTATGAPAAARDPADIGWRDFLADARLRRVVGLALDNNRDLRVSALNIERARAQYRVQDAARYPEIAAGASASSQRLPTDLSRLGRAYVGRTDSVTIGISAWEIDFWGRLRNLSEQAAQSYLATEDALRAARISLVAEVSTAWLTLAADGESLRLASETLRSREASLRLTQDKLRLGAASALDMQQARSLVEGARADVENARTLVAQDRNALALLVGGELPADALPADLDITVTQLAELPAGLPSDVLVRRPDVRQAERTLAGANASIGAARAAYFPNISLTANYGTASAELGGLFKGGSAYWTFAPSVNLPIFDMGRRRANVQIAEADRDIAVASYEKAIQSAFREVADALARRATIDSELAARQAAVDASAEALRLTEARYRQGGADYLGVLDAQRSLYAAQQSLIAARLARAGNLVTLYKVLGGGWRDDSAS